jgi:hypothetical protein
MIGNFVYKTLLRNVHECLHNIVCMELNVLNQPNLNIDGYINLKISLKKYFCISLSDDLIEILEYQDICYKFTNNS